MNDIASKFNLKGKPALVKIFGSEEIRRNKIYCKQ